MKWRPGAAKNAGMWFSDTDANGTWDEAVRALGRADPALRKIIRRVGPCTLRPRRDYFVKLCQSIYTQQISTAVAAVLFGRFRDRFPNRRPTPARVLEFLRGADEAAVRAVGLSRQKRAYLQDLAAHWVDGRIPSGRFAGMTDQQIMDALLPVKGVGRWTVEMFLIFCLNRPDVWPVDDFGVRKAVQVSYGMTGLPGRKELEPFGERWRPWRTVATWYLWRGLDGGG